MLFECTKGDRTYPPQPGAGCRGTAREQPELERAGALIAILMGDEGCVRGLRQRKGERLVKVVQRSGGKPVLPGSTSCTALGLEAVKEGSW